MFRTLMVVIIVLLSVTPLLAEISHHNDDTALIQSARHHPHGVDISKYQGNLIQNLDHHSGLSFVICKATEGATYTDPDFALNWKSLRQKDLTRGAYHFYRSNKDPIVQADHYLATVNSWRLLWHRGFKADDLPPIVDIEADSLKSDHSQSLSTTKLQQDLLRFLRYVESKTNRKPIIYTGLYFANTYLNHSDFGDYPLWLADYSNQNAPQVPVAWQKTGVTFWQKSFRFTIDSQGTDFDIFFGSLENLKTGLNGYPAKPSQ